ncbi:MAG: hypothetical protein NUV53_01745 [Patescibacteria group bacterium]|nr:hypothetical protein [Patescibacteria group bacterium]
MENAILGVVSGAVLGAGFYALIGGILGVGHARANNVALFLVSPSEEDATNEVLCAEKLLRILGRFGKPFTLEAVVPHVGDRVHFYVAVSRGIAGVVRAKMKRIFGAMSVEQVHDDHIVLYPHGVTVGAYVMKKDQSSLSIPLYRDVGADVFKDVIEGLRVVHAVGEGAGVQIVAIPVVRKELVSYNTNVRVVVSAGSEFRTRDILDGIVRGFGRFRGSGRNALTAVKVRNAHTLVRQFLARTYTPEHSMALSGDELATIYHFSATRESELS